MDFEKWKAEKHAELMGQIADASAVACAVARADLDQRHAALAELRAAAMEVYADAEASLNADERALLSADLRRLRHERDALRAEIRALESKKSSPAMTGDDTPKRYP